MDSSSTPIRSPTSAPLWPFSTWAKSLAAAESCESDRLRDGVRAFGYAILSGRGRHEALALARRFFHGVKTELCVDNGTLYTPPQIEQQLIKSQRMLEAAR